MQVKTALLNSSTSAHTALSGGGFAAERPVGTHDTSFDSCGRRRAYQLQARSATTAPQHAAQQQMRAASRREPTDEAENRHVNTVLQ